MTSERPGDQSVEQAQVADLVMADPNPEVADHTHTTAAGHPANLERPEIDWPCDFPTPHPAHEASAYDPLGILLGYTEHCHGGMVLRPGKSDEL